MCIIEMCGDGFAIIQMSSLGKKLGVWVCGVEGGGELSCLRGRDGSYCLEQTKGVVTSLMFSKINSRLLLCGTVKAWKGDHMLG